MNQIYNTNQIKARDNNTLSPSPHFSPRLLSSKLPATKHSILFSILLAIAKKQGRGVEIAQESIATRVGCTREWVNKTLRLLVSRGDIGMIKRKRRGRERSATSFFYLPSTSRYYSPMSQLTTSFPSVGPMSQQQFTQLMYMYINSYSLSLSSSSCVVSSVVVAKVERLSTEIGEGGSGGKQVGGEQCHTNFTYPYTVMTTTEQEKKRKEKKNQQGEKGSKIFLVAYPLHSLPGLAPHYRPGWNLRTSKTVRGNKMYDIDQRAAVLSALKRGEKECFYPPILDSFNGLDHNAKVLLSAFSEECIEWAREEALHSTDPSSPFNVLLSKCKIWCRDHGVRPYWSWFYDLCEAMKLNAKTLKGKWEPHKTNEITTISPSDGKKMLTLQEVGEIGDRLMSDEVVEFLNQSLGKETTSMIRDEIGRWLFNGSSYPSYIPSADEVKEKIRVYCDEERLNSYGRIVGSIESAKLYIAQVLINYFTGVLGYSDAHTDHGRKPDSPTPYYTKEETKNKVWSEKREKDRIRGWEWKEKIDIEN